MRFVLLSARIYLRIQRWSLIWNQTLVSIECLLWRDEPRCHFWRFLNLIGAAAACAFEWKCKSPIVSNLSSSTERNMWPTYDWQQYRNKILSATPSRCSGRHKKRKCRCMHTLRSGRVCLSAVRQNHFTIFPSNILLFFGLCLGHFISFLSFRLFIMAFFSCGRTHIRIARTTSNATSSHYFQWQYFVFFYFSLLFRLNVVSTARISKHEY